MNPIVPKRKKSFQTHMLRARLKELRAKGFIHVFVEHPRQLRLAGIERQDYVSFSFWKRHCFANRIGSKSIEYILLNDKALRQLEEYHIKKGMVAT